MLVSKIDMTLEDGVYRPPKFAPVSMEEDKISKQERKTSRKEKDILKQAVQSTYMKEVWNEVEGRPEEVKDFIGAESRELNRFREKWKSVKGKKRSFSLVLLVQRRRRRERNT